MARFDDILRSGTNVSRLLAQAGVRPDFIKEDRAFRSKWAWDDGVTPVCTVWREDMEDVDGTPRVLIPDPALRTDLKRQRKTSARERHAVVAKYVGQPIRVILQTKHAGADQPGPKNSVTQKRAVDRVPWVPAMQGTTVIVQRGSPLEPVLLSVEGKPMPPREPTFALRETRPGQAGFRSAVSPKSGGKCALTGAPGEVCDAAHFPWANWRTDNLAKHGALLRRDLHAALDCGLIDVDAEGHVVVSEYLASTSAEYRSLHGKRVPI